MRAVVETHVVDIYWVLTEHLTWAGDLRDMYRAACAKAKRGEDAEYAVISFDYSVQLSIPHFTRETANQYYVAHHGLDANQFDIVDESGPAQTNFIYSERYKHGSNHVVSMLHYYFNMISRAVGRVAHLHLYSDSCSGQNRNNILLLYLFARVHQGKHDLFRWRFMAVGHTKFSPNHGFGLVRMKKVCDTYTLEDVTRMISESTPNTCRMNGIIMPDSAFRAWKIFTDPDSACFRKMQGI